jgi:hypothetical protein
MLRQDALVKRCRGTPKGTVVTQTDGIDAVYVRVVLYRDGVISVLKAPEGVVDANVVQQWLSPRVDRGINLVMQEIQFRMQEGLGFEATCDIVDDAICYIGSGFI